MIRVTALLEPDALHELQQAIELVLTYDQRKRGRLRATSTCRREIGLFLERGRTLCDGDLLAADNGVILRVRAANEHVSCAHTSDTLLLTRAAYHLGNRHVPLQIGSDTLVYQHDHVLDDMVRGLGLDVVVTDAPFHPESGAYHSHAHSHGQHEHAASALAPPVRPSLSVVSAVHEH